MPDICDLILDEHHEFRRRFAEMDALRAENSGPERLERVWSPLAERLELHASVEEAVFYPWLLEEGGRGREETADAIDDHNDIRDAVRRAASEAPGTDAWWDAVLGARAANSDHMAEEERGAIADFRIHGPVGQRERLGASWIDYRDEHAGGRGVDGSDVDRRAYLSRYGPD